MKFNIGYGTPRRSSGIFDRSMLTTGQGSTGFVPLPKDISRYDRSIASIESSTNI